MEMKAPSVQAQMCRADILVVATWVYVVSVQLIQIAENKCFKQITIIFFVFFSQTFVSNTQQRKILPKEIILYSLGILKKYVLKAWSIYTAVDSLISFPWLAVTANIFLERLFRFRSNLYLWDIVRLTIELETGTLGFGFMSA